jgi:hypothetical protein
VSKHPNLAKSLWSLNARMALAFHLPYGSRLRVFMETAHIMQGFTVDMRKVGSADWQYMYEFLLINLDPDEIMRSYIVWNASISRFKMIRRFAYSGVFDALMNGFATMLVDFPRLRKKFDAYQPSSRFARIEALPPAKAILARIPSPSGTAALLRAVRTNGISGRPARMRAAKWGNMRRGHRRPAKDLGGRPKFGNFVGRPREPEVARQREQGNSQLV